jgi:hypothetical protein
LEISMNPASTPLPNLPGGNEEDEIERRADEIEAAWGADRDADIRSLPVPRSAPVIDVPRSTAYWIAAGIASIGLATYPVIFGGGGFVPLVLLVVAGVALVGGTVWIETAENRWAALAVGVLGLFLMSAGPVIAGVDGALTSPTEVPRLAALWTVLLGNQAGLWALGVLTVYASWLVLTRRPPFAYLTVPILGVGVLVVQWLFSLLGTVTNSGSAFALGGPALVYDLMKGTLYWAPDLVVYFVLSRAVEVVGVLLCLRLAERLVQRAAVAREAALTQSVQRANATGRPVTAAPVAGVERTNTLAILSLIFAFVFPLIGVILGHVARSQIQRSGEQGSGLTFAALIIGYIAIGAVLLVFIISAVVTLVSRGV